MTSEPKEGTLEHLAKLIETSFYVHSVEIHPGSATITERLSVCPPIGPRPIEFRIGPRRDVYEVWNHTWNKWTPVQGGVHLLEIMDRFGFARKQKEKP